MFKSCFVPPVPDVEFNGILKDTKVVEGQDAAFECTLSDPVPQITWCANDISIEHGDKYDVTVSEDKQVHKLTVKNCSKDDKGVYTAIAGLRSSQGTLVVEGRKIGLAIFPSLLNCVCMYFKFIHYGSKFRNFFYVFETKIKKYYTNKGCIY